MIASVGGRCGHFQVFEISPICTKALMSAMLQTIETYAFPSQFTVDHRISQCSPLTCNVVSVVSIITHRDPMVIDCLGDVPTNVNNV